MPTNALLEFIACQRPHGDEASREDEKASSGEDLALVRESTRELRQKHGKLQALTLALLVKSGSFPSTCL